MPSLFLRFLWFLSVFVLFCFGCYAVLLSYDVMFVEQVLLQCRVKTSFFQVQDGEQQGRE